MILQNQNERKNKGLYDTLFGSDSKRQTSTDPSLKLTTLPNKRLVIPLKFKDFRLHSISAKPVCYFMFKKFEIKDKKSFH